MTERKLLIEGLGVVVLIGFTVLTICVAIWFLVRRYFQWQIQWLRAQFGWSPPPEEFFEVYFFCKNCGTEQIRGTKFCSKCRAMFEPLKKMVTVYRCTVCGTIKPLLTKRNEHYSQDGGKFIKGREEQPIYISELPL